MNVKKPKQNQKQQNNGKDKKKVTSFTEMALSHSKQNNTINRENITTRPGEYISVMKPICESN